jgi:hypothetical protein
VSDVLKVDPDVLRKVGTAFGKAGDGLAGVDAGTPLGEAASAVPQLQTAAACAKAQDDVTAEIKVLADDARKYAENLNSAAQQYQTGDEASAAAIRRIEFPQPPAEGTSSD